MSMQERAKTIRSDINERRLTHGLDKTERERDRLKVENDVLRGRMAHADEEREHLLSSVDELASRGTPKTRKHRLRRVVVLGAAAGSAYVLGAKAGRERYEQLQRRWTEFRDRFDRGRDEGFAGGGVVPNEVEVPASDR
jgi:hypothetical protein